MSLVLFASPRKCKVKDSGNIILLSTKGYSYFLFILTQNSPIKIFSSLRHADVANTRTRAFVQFGAAAHFSIAFMLAF